MPKLEAQMVGNIGLYYVSCWQPAQMGRLGAREIRGVEESAPSPRLEDY